MRSLILVCCTIVMTAQVCSQPYVDPLQARFTYGFRNKNAEATPFTHLWIGSDIPVKLKEKTYLLFSPYYESWQIDSAEKNEIVPAVQSMAFPVGVLLPIGNADWGITVLPIVRTNGEDLFGDNTIQYGGVVFTSYARKPDQKFRIGVYVNKEFFGWFVMPLAGIDWKMGNKDYLFGLLPGRLTYEHQWSKNFFGGATFRAITNSYRLKNGHYLRLDDNQVSLYMDYYPAKRFCITLEPGYGLVRKMRTGINNKHYITDRKWGDGPFIKLSGSYRVRL